ncbi:Folliculin [Halotydeus destructor]|nr:Folliculin [Halotydeus destructor]
MDAVLVCCHFCEIHGPSVVFCTKAYPWHLDTEEFALGKQSDTDQCVGCSFAKPKGFLCRDKDENVKYVTSRLPLTYEVDANLVQQACVRSLSCEVYPQGREGIIYFGDDERGHVMSDCFLLRDSQARGFQRTYSFLVIEKDKYRLLNKWLFYTEHFTRIISQLKEKANAVHDSELRQTSCHEKRSIRLNSVVQVGPQSRHPSNTQRSSSKARPLSELTNDGKIYAALHLEFTWILKAAQVTSRISNFSLETPSEADELNGILISNGCSVRWLYKLVGTEKFISAAYHTIIGNQIIVRSKNKQVTQSVLMALTQLLPRGCVRAIFYSNEYMDLNQCNILGLPDTVTALPECKFLIINAIGSGNSHDLQCFLHTFENLPVKLPTYLTELEKILRDDKLSDEAFNSCFDRLKKEWLNKAKLAYGYVKTFKPAKVQDMTLLYKMIDGSLHDVELLRFWMLSGLSNQFKDECLLLQNSIRPQSFMTKKLSDNTVEPVRVPPCSYI